MKKTDRDLSKQAETAIWKVFLKYFALSILGLIGFYIIILIFIALLIKEEDKSFKNIITKIKDFLSTFAMQIMFFILSFSFGLLITLPFVYFAKTNGKIFANIVLLLIILVVLYLYVKRIIAVYIKEKSISGTIAALFPAWFKILFWIAFSVYFVPFVLGKARTNFIIGLILFIAAVILVNCLFYAHSVAIYISRKFKPGRIKNA